MSTCSIQSKKYNQYTQTLHMCKNTLRFKHSKQLNAATAWTQTITLLQLPISKAKSATLGKTKQA